MSEAPDKPEDQASGQPQPDDEERPPLRQVSEDELKEVLEAHERWVQSDGKEGERAHLRDANLEGAHLGGANLEGAYLRGANLRGANLEGAHLRRANLQGAHLRRANLRRAHLLGANLRRAHLRRANLQGADLLGANLRRAHLRRANLQGAHLRRANLEGAHLDYADLQGADLRLANLQEADLTDANLQGANLCDAKLRGVNLKEGKLQGAQLHNTRLRDANLERAQFVAGSADPFGDATGFSGDQFSGADVTGVTLPDEIAEFKVLRTVEETSKNARKIFLAMLLGCAYAWLTVATTTDARLLTNSASSPLPIIGTEIPIAWFYLAAPFILMGLYVYLHFYLELLWEGLAGLPARFPDGKRLDERAYPWLLNGLVRRHFKLLKENRPLIAKLKEWVTIFLAWWAVPATLFGFWLRYLPRHEWAGTGLNIGLLVVSVGFAIIFYHSAAATLRGNERQKFSWKTPWRDRRTYQSAGIALVAVVFSLLSLAAIQGDPWTRLAFPPLATANLREADVSTKPENWRGEEKDIPLVKGASLRGSDLRYADAESAFLVKADLRFANLQGANLGGADLQGANLGGADLQGAKLQGAKLVSADLQGANLRLANLQRANLTGANLRGASLDNANLEGAYLNKANLQEASLRGANLEGAKLQGAFLVRADLQVADLRLAGLQGANLLGANLQRAGLFSANLQRANLTGANLRGASLDNANLQVADLRLANLQEASLRGANLEGAKNLTAGQLDQACGDAKTKLPPNLSIRPCPEESK